MMLSEILFSVRTKQVLFPLQTWLTPKLSSPMTTDGRNQTILVPSGTWPGLGNIAGPLVERFFLLDDLGTGLKKDSAGWTLASASPRLPGLCSATGKAEWAGGLCLGCCALEGACASR